MKLYVTIAMLLCSMVTTNAQLVENARSATFEEPRNGYAKIFHNDAGETYYVHISNTGLMLKKYDLTHKLVQSKNIKSKFGDLHRGNLLSVTCRNSTITVFTSEMENRTPTLYRQLIDASTCELKEESQIDSMPKIKIKVKMAFTVSERDLNRKFQFFVKTDPATGAYATAAYYTDEETNKQVRISHYNSEHKLLSNAGFFKEDSKFSFYDYKDMLVNGNESVVAMVVGSSGKVGSLMAGVLNAGTTTFKIKDIAFPGAKDIENSLMAYNPANQQFVAISVSEKSGGAVSSRTTWNMATDAVTTETITGATLIKSGKAGRGTLLKPAVQQLRLNGDGSYTAIFEDMKHEQRQYSSFSGMGTSGGAGASNSMMKTKTSNKFYLNNLAVVEYDADGKLINSEVLQKSFQVGMPISLSYMNNIEEAGITLTWGLQFKTFYYVNGKSKKYLIFNDDVENQARLNSKKKPETIVGLENCAAYLLPIGADEEAQRQPLFAEPTTKKNRQLVVAAASSYSASANEIAMLTVNYSDKKANIVWMKAE